jgi:hypothetical protein
MTLPKRGGDATPVASGRSFSPTLPHPKSYMSALLSTLGGDCQPLSHILQLTTANVSAAITLQQTARRRKRPRRRPGRRNGPRAPNSPNEANPSQPVPTMGGTTMPTTTHHLLARVTAICRSTSPHKVTVSPSTHGLGVWLHDPDPMIDERNWREFQNCLNASGLSWLFSPRSHEVVFMDLRLTIEGGRIKSSLYAKPMALHLYLLPHSCHAPGVLSGLVFGNVLRIHQLCSDAKDITMELKLFFHRLLDRGYQSHQLTPSFPTGHGQHHGIPPPYNS